MYGVLLCDVLRISHSEIRKNAPRANLALDLYCRCKRFTIPRVGRSLRLTSLLKGVKRIRSWTWRSGLFDEQRGGGFGEATLGLFFGHNLGKRRFRRGCQRLSAILKPIYLKTTPSRRSGLL